MNTILNQDVLSGQWKQIRGKVKQWWGKLTDNDMERISGRMDILIGIVQERYGHTRKQAETEVARFMKHFKR